MKPFDFENPPYINTWKMPIFPGDDSSLSTRLLSLVGPLAILHILSYKE
jgi:hypothetical protein